MSFIVKLDTCPRLGCATIPNGYFVTLCFSALPGGNFWYSPAANSDFVDLHLTQKQLEDLYQFIGEYLAYSPEFALEKSKLVVEKRS